MQACEEYREAPSRIKPYEDFYQWVAYHVLKGRKTPTQVRDYAERAYNSRTTENVGQGQEQCNESDDDKEHEEDEEADLK